MRQPPNLVHLTDDVFRRAIDHMETEFDSHQIIVDIMTNEPAPYIHELGGLIHVDAPFQELHKKMGARLCVFAPELIVKRDRVESANIFGRVNENQGWRRV
jgi:hypothetical protein